MHGGEYAHRLEGSVAQVHRFVARRVANHADAADIAQQTLLQACAKLDTFRGENFSAWVLTIARHLIVDFHRAHGRYQFVDVEQALADAEPALRTSPDAVVAVCECHERRDHWLHAVTHCLRLEQQVAVLLADIYGHRDKDSAAILRMTVPCFKLLLHGARARLQANATEQGTAGLKAGACRAGVVCPVCTPELRALCQKLLNGVVQ